MKLINDNLKKTGYFNAALIVIAIIMKLITLKDVSTLVKVDSIVCIIALVFGLFYSLNGYKKDAAKYYKSFMYLFFVSSVLSLLVPSIAPLSGKTNYFIASINVIILVLVFLLAFIKDLGVNKSTNISMLILILNIVKLFYNVQITVFLLGFSNLVLACILCVFVSAKYADKEARGAK